MLCNMSSSIALSFHFHHYEGLRSMDEVAHFSNVMLGHCIFHLNLLAVLFLPVAPSL